MTKSDTSWQDVAKWYDSLVADKGHYFHRQIIFPRLKELWDFDKVKNPKLLDIGCGQGVLSREIPSHIKYVGIDASKTLIKNANTRKAKGHKFICSDATMPINEKDCTHVTMILSLQNMNDPKAVLLNARETMTKKGKIFLVLNHPCFRIPRQTHWGVDPNKQLQYRQIDCYLNPLKIPIQGHPSKGSDSKTTWSFHHPLSFFVSALREAGFVITHLEEWISDKESQGKKAKMENRARTEFPLFLTLIGEAI